MIDPIVESLVAERKRRGIPQAQIAEALKVKQSTISRYEKGVRPMDTVMLRRYAAALGVGLAWRLVTPITIKEPSEWTIDEFIQ